MGGRLCLGACGGLDFERVGNATATSPTESKIYITTSTILLVYTLSPERGDRAPLPLPAYKALSDRKGDEGRSTQHGHSLPPRWPGLLRLIRMQSGHSEWRLRHALLLGHALLVPRASRSSLLSSRSRSSHPLPPALCERVELQLHDQMQGAVASAGERRHLLRTDERHTCLGPACLYSARDEL